MLGNIFHRWSQDIGIDLGTTNTLVYAKDKGIVVSEPSIVAINNRTDQILAVGEEARKMVGKAPSYITVTRPIIAGIISDFEVAEKMIKYFIDRVRKENYTLHPRPRVVIGIPLDVTEVERKAVEDATLSAGAGQVYLIEQPVAAAIGARLPIQEPTGNMLVELGGGTTEIAVISLGGVVTFTSIKSGGLKLDNDIIQYVRENFNLLLGERSAEELKISLGNVYPTSENPDRKVRGRDLYSGLPREVTISSAQVREAIIKNIRHLIESIRDTVEKTPPELVAEIYQKGVVLSGGGALMKGIDKLISTELKIPVHVTDDPLTGVVRGTGMVLEDLNSLKSLLLPSAN
ncbi:MAG: rod shape-determining protein [Candidatus Komeilibacteria bacterium]|nr:rod shape-determining protein [Candidatus Komeilibacteria bacterium]